MLTRATRFCLFVLLVLLASFSTALAQETVALGSDYFQSVAGNGDSSGTWFNFGSGIGVVDFQGVPIGNFNGLNVGNTDTIVQRQADATLNMGSVPIQLVALSLGSTAPVLVGGNLYNVSLTLQNKVASTGTITIMGNLSGGTFTSSLSVFFDAFFKPVAGGSPFDIKSEVTLTNAGAVWSSTPEAGTLLVHGAFGDQIANCHNGTGPLGCLNPNGSDENGEVDFFLDGSLMECNDPDGCHVVKPVSEPAALLLVVPALIGMFWKLRSTPV